MKIVKVPDEDLRKLEEARVSIYQFFEENGADDSAFSFPTRRLVSITGPIWYCANRKYPETIWSKIKRTFTNQ